MSALLQKSPGDRRARSELCVLDITDESIARLCAVALQIRRAVANSVQDRKICLACIHIEQ